MGKQTNKIEKKTITKTKPPLTIPQATHLIDKNSRTIVKLCQLIEGKKRGKEIDINYDQENLINKRIEKLKGRINKRLAKLAKWVDMPDHEQVTMIQNRVVYQTRANSNNNNYNNVSNGSNNGALLQSINFASANLLSKHRSKSTPVNKVANIQPNRQLPPRQPPPRYPNHQGMNRPFPQNHFIPTIPGQHPNFNSPTGNLPGIRPLLQSQQNAQPRPIPIPRAMMPPRSGLMTTVPYPRQIVSNHLGDGKGWGLIPNSTSQLSSLMSLQKQIAQESSLKPLIPQSLLHPVPLISSAPSKAPPSQTTTTTTTTTTPSPAESS